ncbi:hypothetical protein AVEN_230288-1 [Araneus ventricosus]|uniref:Uncharacterized protein n=1 Tax=Araneus ventricosus TaxID=182803 RepID=A0A4Y2SHN8_ARAVE|nr:hypothetical protein AVEN_230288-1 [Araneus ventricosus]
MRTEQRKSNKTTMVMGSFPRILHRRCPTNSVLTQRFTHSEKRRLPAMYVYRRKRVALAYLVYKKYISKQNRRYWVHPFVDSRLSRGRFRTTFGDLRENPDKFFNYFRMSVQSFDELAAKITHEIQNQNTRMRLSIPPLEMLAVTIR